MQSLHIGQSQTLDEHQMALFNVDGIFMLGLSVPVCPDYKMMEETDVSNLFNGFHAAQQFIHIVPNFAVIFT